MKILPLHQIVRKVSEITPHLASEHDNTLHLTIEDDEFGTARTNSDRKH